MLPYLTEYHRPADLEQALRLLGRPTPRTAPLAGGTWLVARRDPSIHAVVDLSRLDLAFVTQSARRLRLGAMTTLQTIAEHPLTQGLAGGLLAEAARQEATPTVRNVATLGGTLVVGDCTSEMLLALLALDARVAIRAATRYELGLDDMLADRVARLPPYALISEVDLPTPAPDAGAALAGVRKTPRDRPIVNAAALVIRRGAACHLARLAVGGVASRPVRLTSVEALLAYQRFGPDLLARAGEAVSSAIDPLDDALASADYRRAMAAVVATRALRDAWARAGKE